MYVLFIRHAVAAPRSGRHERDEDRPLTAKGERRFRAVAGKLARLWPRPQAILTSPLLRVRQTASLAAQAWGNLRPKVLPALAAGDWTGICHALAAYKSDDTVVLIGHEDWMSKVTAGLLGSKRNRSFAYRKGGVALIEIEKPEDARGTLLCFVPPRVLRRL